MSINTAVRHIAAVERVLSTYPGQAEPVVAEIVTALEDREDEIKSALREFANSKGLGDAEVDRVFEHVGLSEPAPEPEPEVETPEQGDDALSRIERMVEQVVTMTEGLVERVDRLEQQVDADGADQSEPEPQRSGLFGRR